MAVGRPANVADLTRTRAETAAQILAKLADAQPPGTRLGSRTELREMCGVSVGTFHEALRILQSVGRIQVRPGPGGGVFVAERSAFARLSAEVDGLGALTPELGQVTRIVRALDDLIVGDAARDAGGLMVDELRRRVAHLDAARDSDLHTVLIASLEVYATIVSASPDSLLRAFAGTLLRAQGDTIEAVPALRGPEWTTRIAQHCDAVRALVDAILAGDVERARALRRSEDLVILFEAAVAASRAD